MNEKIRHPCKGCSSKRECFESFDCEEYQHYIGVTEFDEELYEGGEA